LEDILSFVLVLLACYLVGAIPTGVILTRLAGSGDIRQTGSGNIGATNVYRVAGRKLGILTLVGDALKGLLPVLGLVLAGAWAQEQIALAAAVTFLGHLYPVYLGFKGGKGVATALGIFLVFSPLAVLIAALAFAAVLWKWQYVSLGSIIAAALVPILVAGFERSLPLAVATCFISAMVIIRHRDNIRRLLAGTENRFKA
jgi:glycerol-3-phosphate acyltransferase PlsY